MVEASWRDQTEEPMNASPTTKTHCGDSIKDIETPDDQCETQQSNKNATSILEDETIIFSTTNPLTLVRDADVLTIKNKYNDFHTSEIPQDHLSDQTYDQILDPMQSDVESQKALSSTDHTPLRTKLNQPD